MIEEIDDFIAGSPMVNAGSADDAASLINNARDLSFSGSARCKASKMLPGGPIEQDQRAPVAARATPFVRTSARFVKGAATSPPRRLRRWGEIHHGDARAKRPAAGRQVVAARVGPAWRRGNLSAAVAGPLGAVPGAAGVVSKFAADHITRQKVDDLAADGAGRGIFPISAARTRGSCSI